VIATCPVRVGATSSDSGIPSDRFADVLSHFEGVRRSGAGWMARCSAHEDRQASLSIREAADGTILLKCHAGCRTADVLPAAGLDWADLFPDEPATARARPTSRPVPPPPAPGAVHETAYEIQDANGALVARHVRVDGPSGKRFHWQRPDGTSGLGRLPTRELPLYGAHLVADCGADETIVLVEGEKAADALLGLSVPALGTVTGASTCPGETALSVLRDRDVALWPDADEPGAAHMSALGEALAGIARSVRRVAWPAAPEKGDAADFVAAGGTAGDVQRLIDDAPLLGVLIEEPEWPPLLPLGSRVALPPFPTDALPDWLRDFIEAEALATQTPVEMAALFCLAVLAALAAKRFVVEANEGWREPLNLFTVVAMEPGSRKSAVHRECTAPVFELEQELIELMRPAIAQSDTERHIAEACRAQLEKSAANPHAENRDVLISEAVAAARAAADTDVPVLPRLIVDDSTPEALVSTMAEQDGKAAHFSAEGGIFAQMSGDRYRDHVPNLDPYLKAHCGDPLRVDRKGRPSEQIDAPALTIALAVQPYVLQAAGRNPALRARGLLDRFLYAVPEGNVGYRDMDPCPLPAVVREAYRAGVRAVSRLAGEQGTDPTILRLAPEAAAIFGRWRADLEPRRRPGAEHSSIVGWSNKLDGAIARIAALLHIASHTERGVRAPIDQATMAAAIRIGEFLVPHALAAFDLMGADERLEAARIVLGWIVRTRAHVVSVRECHREFLSRFSRSAEAEAVLVFLAERGYLAALAQPTGRKGRPPSPRYLVNPALWEERAALTTPASTGAPSSSVSCVSSVRAMDASEHPIDPVIFDMEPIA
jgi:hypothetical protein